MELGQQVPTPFWRQRRVIVAGVCALCLGAAVITYLGTSPTPVRPQGVELTLHPLPKALAKMLREADAEFAHGQALRANRTALLELSEGFTTDCYSFTGGTCNLWGCDSFRKASCKLYVSGYVCMCAPGQCTSVSGQCTPGKYRKLAGGVKVKNVKWPNERLYFPQTMVLSQLAVTAEVESAGYDDEFDMYLLPGTLQGQYTVLMSSTKQPDYVVHVAKGLPANLKVQTLKIDRFFRDIQQIATVLCKPHGTKENIFQLGTTFKQLPPMTMATTAWWYVWQLGMGNRVWGWPYGDPKSGGYWTFDPPIDQQLANLGVRLPEC